MFKKIQWEILFISLQISFLGILIIFSFNPSMAKNQLLFLILGLFLYLFFSFFDYRILKNFSWFLYFLSLFLLGITLVIGLKTRGSVRWLKIGFFGFQTSEIVKPLLICSFAFLAKTVNLRKITHFLFFLFLIFLPSFLVFKQPDLGNSLVLAVIGMAIVFNTNTNKWFKRGLFLAIILWLPFFWQVLKPYQKQRLISFINPAYDSLGAGYQLIQAKTAVGAGQFFGRGLGQGTQSHLRFLPERHTDFIFASLAEEFGFLGGTFLLFLYFFLLFKILKITSKTKEKFSYLVGIGVFFMIFFQTIINIGMNLAILPITGITLPLFSLGGSSLISTMISLGIIQNISFNLKRELTIEIK